MPGTDVLKEAERIMTICNACRYCEGHCAVFPAMERRLAFGRADLNYLANLCHNCGSCYHHCQYAPPHEFAVNIPQTFTELRAQTYRDYAWPGFLARLFERNGLAAGLITAAALALFMVATVALVEPAALTGRHGGNFYAVIPHNVMAGVFGAVALYVALALFMGGRNFWRDMEERGGDFVAPVTFGQALRDALTLRHLGGGSGDGCTYPTQAPSLARRRFHHATFYGFLLCFAATAVATVYHYVFGWAAPYPVFSLPVLLGTVGGIGLIVGPAGLMWLKAKSDPVANGRGRFGMDVSFLVLLMLTSLTGLLLLALRDTGAMGVALAVHLGIVAGLFLTLPYGKFVHAVYRFCALVRYALERARPAAPGLPGEG
ncbi:tricarballylate utilization 4Fe-4S protein TcuB [Azospirillum sp.]|uniref:tricarballylate utilization 4Fe-4S protein TcuB n=1 Tax=Azospirillum sp. TaxID=34012 RepID=UPI002D47EF52|nr:tricarballylate utilization 4Fe-4S protein TcuB [Azospirillum sp.]HYD66896.1 tricarballylate utilization 4Fe-4S protein TcuB [Azospirillum sp.]